MRDYNAGRGTNIGKDNLKFTGTDHVTGLVPEPDQTYSFQYLAYCEAARRFLYQSPEFDDVEKPELHWEKAQARTKTTGTAEVPIGYIGHSIIEAIEVGFNVNYEGQTEGPLYAYFFHFRPGGMQWAPHLEFKMTSLANSYLLTHAQ